MMTDGFLDTRLHITVRPLAEYAIPDVSQVVRGAILGDVTTEDAMGALRRLQQNSAFRHDEVEPIELGELSSHCMRVVNHAVEHVKQIEVDWLEFLKRTDSGVRSEMREIKRVRQDVTAVYRRYKVLHPAIAEREYKVELQRLARRMEDALERYRAADPPTTERSAELKASTQALREAFAVAYGKAPTRDLMRLRQYFEFELSRMQIGIVDSFVKRCVDILGVPA